MALFRRFFYRKPPDGLLEITERVYVFDSCFSTDVLEEDTYRMHMRQIATLLREQFPDSSFLVFNFREGERKSQLTEILSQYDMTVMDYPRQYEGCPILSLEIIHHFMRSADSWITLEGHHNIVLLHCERGGWPTLAFMLAGLLIYRRLQTSEPKTLDLIHREAPKGLLPLLSPLNPIPSQIRYLQYIARRNISQEWPPPDRALMLDCLILRVVPSFDTEGGCRPLIRVYGLDPLSKGDRTTHMLFSMEKKSKLVRHIRQADCDVVKIDIQCGVQGDVVLECIHIDTDLEREQMMFRVMFNTSFIRSNILMLGKDEIDALWDAKDRFTKDFRAEVLFTDMASAKPSSSVVEMLGGEEKVGLPVEAFAKVQELFNNVSWSDVKENATLRFLKQISSVNAQSGMDVLNEEGFDNSDMNEAQLMSPRPRTPGSMVGVRTPPVTSKSASLQKQPEMGVINLESSSLELLKSAVLEAKGGILPVSSSQQLRSPAPTPTPTPTPTLAPAPAPTPASAPASAPAALPPSSSLVVSSLSPAVKVPPPPPPPPPLPPPSVSSSLSTVKAPPPPPPPPPPPMSGYKAPSMLPPGAKAPPPPPPPPMSGSKAPSMLPPGPKAPPPPPPPPLPPPPESKAPPSPPPPPPPPSPVSKAPPPPPPPPPGSKAPPKGPPPPPPPPGMKGSPAPPPPPPPGKKGPPAPPVPPAKKASGTAPMGQPPPPTGNVMSGPPAPPSGNVKGPPPPASSAAPGAPPLTTAKKASLKPFHWVKVTRAVQGSLWAEAQKLEEASKCPEIDASELASLFSASVPNAVAESAGERRSGRRASLGSKPEKVHLIDMRRANNCEIMLTKVKMPLPDVLSAILALDGSILDVDQVENLIKFCPTKEEMDLLKGYTGDKEKLGKCEQFFLEMMKVPRVESKLRVFSFKLQFSTQVNDLRRNLSIVNNASKEVRESMKFRQIMQTILSLGNALNQGTARGSAIGFKLDSLLKLTDTRARDNKMTLMHYLCKVLSDKLPDLLDYQKDLAHLEEASKVHLKFLAEEMQAVSKSLGKVEQELTASESDGPVSERFRKNLKSFLDMAEAEGRSLTLLYSEVGRNADALAHYFGEDPARCPFEQVVSVLLNFVVMFKKAHDENCKLIAIERKKAEREAEQDKVKHSPSRRDIEVTAKRDAELSGIAELGKSLRSRKVS